MLNKVSTNQKNIAMLPNSLQCHDNHQMLISDKVKSNVIQWLFPKVDSLLVVKSLSYCLNIQAFLSISQFIKHLYGVEIFFFPNRQKMVCFSCFD